MGRKFLIGTAVAVIVLSFAALGILMGRDSPVEAAQNPLAVDGSALSGVELCFDYLRHEETLMLNGTELEEFCDLWNSSWVCRLEPYHYQPGLEDSELKPLPPMKQGGSWDIVTFCFRDGSRLEYRITEEFILHPASGKVYFHTNLLILNYITEKFGWGAEANLW